MTGCSRGWEVDALREGRLSAADAISHERHRSTCAECRHRFEADERSAELARALDTPMPDPLAIRRQRGEVLRRAALGDVPRARARWAAAGAMLVAAITVAALLLSSRPRPVGPSGGLSSAAPSARVETAPAYASTITPIGAASWERSRVGGREVVRLDFGTIGLEVRKQSPSEQFVVEVPDGRIEVRGTRFAVDVESGHTQRVSVDEGVVAWTPTGKETFVLHAGEAWLRPSEGPAVIASARPAVPVPSARSSGHPNGTSEIADEYAAAMAAYRARQYDDAAAKFGAFAAAHPRAPEAEDAAFLEAASLARAGRTDAAALVAERFLGRHRTSIHARDAAILVARYARDRGDCEKARNVVSSWNTGDSASADITGALGACR